MKYIIMCGGDYPKWETPRQLLEINGEPIVARTIRLLRENGITDIAISSDNDIFEQFGLPVLRHDNDYTSYEYNSDDGYWCNAFYPTDEPTCYLFGDVVFSPAAIKTIVETKTRDIMFFASAYPLAPEYPKPYVEPFAFKVADTDHLKHAIWQVKTLDAQGKFKRRPIAWELWDVIRGDDPNNMKRNGYVVINDYTCDIDRPSEIPLMEKIIAEIARGEQWK